MPRTFNISNLTPDTIATFDSLTVNNNLTVSGSITAATGVTVGATGDIRLEAARFLYFDAAGNTNYISETSTNIIDFVAGNANNLRLASTSVVINESGGDIDFRIESDTNANHFVSDAGAFAGVGAFGFGSAVESTSFIFEDALAYTATSNQNAYRHFIKSTNAVTITAATTSPVVASLAINEPNITANGTATDAYTVYISGAPTEGTRNGALWVASGTARYDGDVKFTSSVGLYFNNGVNGTFANVTLSGGGTALFYSTKLTANSIVFTSNRTGGTPGAMSVGTFSAGAVQIRSSSASDTGVVSCLIVEPN